MSNFEFKINILGKEYEVCDSEWTVIINGRDSIVAPAVFKGSKNYSGIAGYLSNDGVKMLCMFDISGEEIHAKYDDCKVFDTFGRRKFLKDEAFTEMGA